MNEQVMPTIDLDLCTGCGLCVDQCPTHAVEMSVERGTEDGRWPVIARPEECAYCGVCEEMCPEGAIALSYQIVFLSDPPEVLT